MADEMLNGRLAADFGVAAIRHARQCERDRDREQLAGLLAEYPRDPVPVPRPVTTLPELP